ncbi:MAG: proline--tRNA ligase, partial [Candidatus Marinimicrobia bacterium]|nr:proline--tRNA ligase [Candidatus Neomarinimicrobiota bacterium]
KDEVVGQIPELLEEIQTGLFQQALKFQQENTHKVSTYDELKKIIKDGGFVRCGWDGTDETEAKVKAETKATIRCIPTGENHQGLTCVYSGKPAKHEVIYAKAY